MIIYHSCSSCGDQRKIGALQTRVKTWPDQNIPSATPMGRRRRRKRRMFRRTRSDSAGTK